MLRQVGMPERLPEQERLKCAPTPRLQHLAPQVRQQQQQSASVDQPGPTRRLAQAGDWIIDCTTGAELIARFGNGTGSGP